MPLPSGLSGLAATTAAAASPRKGVCRSTVVFAISGARDGDPPPPSSRSERSVWRECAGLQTRHCCRVTPAPPELAAAGAVAVRLARGASASAALVNRIGVASGDPPSPSSRLSGGQARAGPWPSSRDRDPPTSSTSAGATAPAKPVWGVLVSAASSLISIKVRVGVVEKSSPPRSSA